MELGGCDHKPSSVERFCSECGSPNADFGRAGGDVQTIQGDVGGSAYFGSNTNWGIQAGGDIVIGKGDDPYGHRIDMSRKVLGKALLPDNWLATAAAFAAVAGAVGFKKFVEWDFGTWATIPAVIALIGAVWTAGYIWTRTGLAKEGAFVAPVLDVVYERAPSGEIVRSRLEAPCRWCGELRNGGVMRLKAVSLSKELRGPWEARWVCDKNPNQHFLGFDHTQVPDFE